MIVLELGASGEWQQRQLRKIDEFRICFEEPTGLAVGLDMGCKGKKIIKLDFQVFHLFCFDLINWQHCG